MFDHVKFGVSDYAASKAFFLKALEPLGVAVVSEGPPPYGVELSPKGKASLCLFQSEEKPALLHLAFMAENRQQVGAFYRAALEAGGKDNGAPGLRARTTMRTTMQLSSLSGRTQHRSGLPRTRGLTFHRGDLPGKAGAAAHVKR
jgi:catechol 2,3-dioxygenase-like lactoylglutathione lyase family enzyme